MGVARFARQRPRRTWRSPPVLVSSSPSWPRSQSSRRRERRQRRRRLAPAFSYSDPPNGRHPPPGYAAAPLSPVPAYPPAPGDDPSRYQHARGYQRPRIGVPAPRRASRAVTGLPAGAQWAGSFAVTLPRRPPDDPVAPAPSLGDFSVSQRRPLGTGRQELALAKAEATQSASAPVKASACCRCRPGRLLRAAVFVVAGWWGLATPSDTPGRRSSSCSFRPSSPSC